MSDYDIFCETGCTPVKPSENPKLIDVNELDLHKGEKPLRKITIHYFSFFMGAATVMVGVMIVVVLIVLRG